METEEIKNYYNNSLRNNSNSYEFERWEKGSQERSSYVSTRNAVEKYAIPIMADGNILELGPGPGTWTKLLLKKSPSSTYDLVDISEEMLKQAKLSLGDRENINYIQSDILDFVSDKKYDFFFSSRIIEYVPDKSKAVQIITNTLKSGASGYLVTKTPHPKRFWGIKNNSPVHQNQISAKDLAKLLKDNECEVSLLTNVTSVFPGIRSGFLDGVLTKLCNLLPFVVAKYVSESYAVVFKKK